MIESLKGINHFLVDEKGLEIGTPYFQTLNKICADGLRMFGSMIRRYIFVTEIINIIGRPNSSFIPGISNICDGGIGSSTWLI